MSETIRPYVYDNASTRRFYTPHSQTVAKRWLLVYFSDQCGVSIYLANEDGKPTGWAEGLVGEYILGDCFNHDCYATGKFRIPQLQLHFWFSVRSLASHCSEGSLCAENCTLRPYTSSMIIIQSQISGRQA